MVLFKQIDLYHRRKTVIRLQEEDQRICINIFLRCIIHIGSIVYNPLRGITMKYITSILSIFVLVFGMATASAEMRQDETGRWVNSEGGNIYGDSNFNMDADPNFNMDADSNFNMDADPNFNMDADPNFNRDGDPRY